MNMTKIETTQPLPTPSLIEAMAIAALPEIEWKQDDDLCDCTYQRIGSWTNPYLAETLEVRMCCIWKELYRQFPQFVREVPAFWDYNKNEWVTEPIEWNGEQDMPRAMWHRQLSRMTGLDLNTVRSMNTTPPQGKPRGLPQPKPVILLRWSGEWIPVELGS